MSGSPEEYSIMSTAAVMPAIDFTELLKGIPRGAWVAISDNSGPVVIGFGSDLNKVLEDAKNKGVADPIVMRVPESSALLMF